MKLSEAFDAFEIDELVSEDRSHFTVENYRKAVTSLLKSIGYDIPVELLTYSHVIQWKKDMFEKGNRTSYIAQLLRNLRTVLAYLEKHGFSTLTASEIKLPKYSYRPTPWLTIEEVGRFLSVISNPRDRAIFALQFSAGARIGEILSLNRDSIVDGRAKVKGKGKKTHDEHEELLFDTNALSALDEYLETRRDNLQPLFISRQNRRICYQQVNNASIRYAEKAGIMRFDPDGKKRKIATHVQRHSFGTNLIMNGQDIYGASKQLRHANIDTTKVYIHGADLRKQSDYNKYHTPTPLN